MGDGRERASRSFHSVTDGTNDMPSGDATGRSIFTRNGFYSVVLKAIGAETASTTGAGNISFGPFKDLYVQLDVTAVSGTLPTLDLYIQTQIDVPGNGVEMWQDIIHFTQMTGTGKRIAIVSGNVTPTTPEKARQDAALAAATVVQGPFGDSIRYKSVIGGTTPSFNYTIRIVAK